MTTLIQHYETHLGPIEEGWSKSESGRELPFQVASFANPPLTGVTAFATLGISNHILRSRVSDKEVRQEFVFLAPSGFGPRNIPALIQDVGEEVLRSHLALLRGDVIGPRGPLFPSSRLEALYVAIPVYLPDDVATFSETRPATVVAWLVPITAPEAAYVAKSGWSLFEDRLANEDPDLVDFEREGLRLD